MEQIAFLVFGGVSGVGRRRSYRSAGPQYDLLVEGDGELWLLWCRHLGIPVERRDFLVECKATRTKVGDFEVARLCAMVEGTLSSTVGLGIFFSLKGASGGPGRGRFSLGAAQLRQTLFLARTSVPVVVFALEDIEALVDSGSFPLRLRQKIRDLSQLCAIPTGGYPAPQEVELPDHLRQLAEPTSP